MSYDYYKLTEDKRIWAWTATLINNARSESANNILCLDNGDTIQSSALGDYRATVKSCQMTKHWAFIRRCEWPVMNAGTIGNHEFNHGVEPFNQNYRQSQF